MRTCIKSTAIAALLLLYTLVSLLLVLLPAGRVGRRRLLTGNTSLFARLVLRGLGIRVTRRRAGRHDAPDRSCLIVANHVSYTDILVLASIRPMVFITSVELKRTFPLGMFARLGGSIFVERRNPAGLKREISDIERTLRDGLSVVLFPEGTTFNGDTVHPFKNSLFTAALSTAAPVLPVCICYRRINGRRIDEGNRDAVYYYGGTTFPEHAPRLLALRSVHVDCLMLDPVEAGPDRSRKDVAARCHGVISAAYHRRR
jgi:1-acyl-sn-glycerol-3-phosphate acyltransferase